MFKPTHYIKKTGFQVELVKYIALQKPQPHVLAMVKHELLLGFSYYPADQLEAIKSSAPTTLAEPDLSFKDDENPLNDPHLWRGK